MLENVTSTWRRERLERMLMQLLMKLRKRPGRKLIWQKLGLVILVGL
jgi:hypothetical protein